jgi:tRNA threonylcarbamoyl adenosine modification protein YjeE
MKEETEFVFSAGSLKDTDLLAISLAGLAEAGEIILLEGDLGAGKTQFVQFFCAALGYAQSVTSPSYAVVNVYPTPKFPVIHADFYRMRRAGEFYELGLEEELERAVLLAEWGTRFASLFDDYLLICIIHLGADARRFELSARGEGWTEKLRRIQQMMST